MSFDEKIHYDTFGDKRGKVIQLYYIILERCLTSSYKLKHRAVKSQGYFLYLLTH